MLRSATYVVTAVGALVAMNFSAVPALADVQHHAVVSENPVDITPHVLDGSVDAVVAAGNRIVVAGEFSQVRNAASGSPVIQRTNIFAYDAATGQIDTSFTPQVDGAIYSLEEGPDDTVYLGGVFGTVNGQTTRRLARMNLSDGSISSEFTRSRIDYGTVNAIVRRGANLYIGGRFNSITDQVTGAQRFALARLDSDTGAVDAGFDIRPSSPRSGTLLVKDLAVDAADSRMVIDGTFTQVNDQPRYQIAMIDLGPTASLSSWSTHQYGNTCSPNNDTYMRGIDFAPDGSYFVVVTTGGGGYGTTGLCTSAARWESDRVGSKQDPTWVNYTGGDSLLSVSVTGAAVYVGGHQRWMDNPLGNNSKGDANAVDRLGIAAIHPTTGKSADIPWNPTRTLGAGAGALVATDDGLLIGSDTDQLGHEYHGRIGMFPLP
ncbi:hypothetical protein [Actinomadura welshii]|uniref:hypothetical protein n=1 Tax=Actinomadura welshii TaxID=3103817 RepID=UPI00041F78C0|nr:hypothetical protein [Actinomadura madurae]